MEKENEDIKTMDNDEKTNDNILETESNIEERQAAEITPNQGVQKRKSKVWAILAVFLLIGGSVGLAAAGGAFTKIEYTPQKNEPTPEPAPVLKQTVIKDKTYEGTLKEFVDEIKYQDASTPISNFKNYFELTNDIADAEYFITNLSLININQKTTETIKLEVKASKSYNVDGEEALDQILTTNLTVNLPVIPKMFNISNNIISINSSWIGSEEYDEWSGDLIIPKTVNGSVVKSIVNGTENDNFSSLIKDKLSSISFEQGCELNSIGDYAFYKTKISGDLDLNSSIEHIGISAFESCLQLNGKLVLPEALISIGELTFANTLFSGILDIPVSTTSIGPSAFEKSTLTEIIVSAELFKDHKETWSQEFIGIVTNRDATIGQFKISAIGTLYLNFDWLKTPEGTSWLETGDLIIPKKFNEVNVYSISSNFMGAYKLSLKSLNFENGSQLKSINTKAFEECTNLSGDLTIPDSVEVIGGDAFSSCKNIDGTLLIGSSVKYIGIFAFFECEKIKTLSFGGNEDLIEI
ncbi:MAG: leucine-rich repeat domain-containing protein, partial [Mycoplasma sp.]